MLLVSVIVPCYNEQATIRLLLDALLEQSFPRAEMEVVIADGGSTDNTRERILSFQHEHPDLLVRVIDNPQRIIPAALNRALSVAQGEYIVRLDAHSMPRPDYITCCLKALQCGKGDNVGGVWEIYPGGESWQARGIAVAAAHPLGVGDAHYRHAEQAQEVDTVPFGAFRRSIVERIGPFDESLLTNEDYEFNTRLRQAGGKVWLDPAIRSTYFARSSFIALARQYWRYGYWKAIMLRRYPQTVRWRQGLPPAFVLSLFVLSVLSPFFVVARWLLVIELVIYCLTILLAGIQSAARKHDWVLILSVPLAITTMHISWGGAFLWSMISTAFGPSRDTRRPSGEMH